MLNRAGGGVMVCSTRKEQCAKASGKDRSHGHRGLEGRPQFWASDEVKVAQVIQIPGGCAKSLDFMLKAARSQDKFKQ